MKTSLLGKAQAAERKPDRDKAAFAVAWLNGEITFTQAQKAVGKSAGSGVYALLARGARDAFRLGMLRKSA